MRALGWGIMVALSLATADANSQTVHAVLVGDTLDSTIGVGVDANLDNIRDFLTRAGVEGEFPVSITEVKGADFNCSNILRAMESLVVGPKDTVFFYYAGHGFRRNETQTQFPEFDCRRTNSQDQAELSGVANALLSPSSGIESPPRLLVAMADTCNTLIEEEPRIAAGTGVGLAHDRKKAFRRLFLEYGGTIVMSGSPPGEPSWYLSSGGFFTTQFLAAVSDKVSLTVDEARWEDIVEETKKDIFIPAGKPAQKPQAATAQLTIVP